MHYVIKIIFILEINHIHFYNKYSFIIIMFQIEQEQLKILYVLYVLLCIIHT